jgi:hypothetical protein
MDKLSASEGVQVVAAGIDTANVVMMPGTVASQQLVAT